MISGRDSYSGEDQESMPYDGYTVSIWVLNDSL